jgi:hypothetical protein
MPDQAWPSVAGAAFRSVVDDQLKREDVRKTSFEGRGLSIITSSGTIVTLVFGLAALATKATDFKLDSTSKTALAVALVLFVAAAACGIGANIPMGYGEIQKPGLDRLVSEEYWLGDLALAQRRVAEAEVDQIVIARRSNGRKAHLLIGGLTLEVLGVLAVAIAVLLILT